MSDAASLVLDLRAEVERTLYQRVADQGRTNRCGGFGGHKTIYECVFEQMGLPYRPVSADWGYQRALEIAGNLGSDPGSGKAELATVMAIGWVYEDQWAAHIAAGTGAPPSALDVTARANVDKLSGQSGQAGRIRVSRDLPSIGNSRVSAITRRLLLGLPVTICIPVSEGLWAGIQQPDWTQHDPVPTAERNTHWASAVGRSYSAARTLVEDSSGPQAWDGGFFGLPDRLVDSPFLVDAWGLDYIPGLRLRDLPPGIPPEPAMATLTKRQVGLWFDAHAHTLPADVVAAYTGNRKPVLWTEALANFERASPLLRAAGGQAAEQGGVPALLDWCRAHGITDHLLEVLASWPRHTVRRHFDAHGLDVNAIDWAPL